MQVALRVRSLPTNKNEEKSKEKFDSISFRRTLFHADVACPIKRPNM